MTYNDEMDLTKDFSTLRFDENYILWNKTQDLTVRGSEMFEGEPWFVQKRVPPSSYIENELKEAGFKIFASQIDKQAEPGHPDMFRLVTKLF
jgi:hypothetical protein